MKKLSLIMVLSILCVACPHIDENTTISEFDICTEVINVDLDDGIHPAKAVAAVTGGNNSSEEFDAELVISKSGRRCSGRFVGKNADFKANRILQIQSITIQDKSGKTIYGSATLPWDEKLIEVKFESFGNPPKKITIIPYLPLLQKNKREDRSKEANNSHLPKEIDAAEKIQQGISKSVRI